MKVERQESFSRCKVGHVVDDVKVVEAPGAMNHERGDKKENTWGEDGHVSSLRYF